MIMNKICKKDRDCSCEVQQAYHMPVILSKSTYKIFSNKNFTLEIFM